ncbi:hypothetical protein Cni_G02202 [Canna indica]|uniref:Uncharacterized protein n=1 Tax=Canna indica TaxID=4628 RepID=A0AAQ3Q219_9LILI|nr:hypothetical protein Cni_G02202 [Canna indica]
MGTGRETGRQGLTNGGNIAGNNNNRFNEVVVSHNNHKVEKEEGELSPNGDFEEHNFVAFEDSSINISPKGKDNSSSRECRVRFGQIEPSHGETAGENDDDDCEESVHPYMDSPNASEAVEDASVSESADGDEFSHDNHEEEDDAEHDQEAKAESEGEAKGIANGQDAEGAILSLPFSE